MTSPDLRTKCLASFGQEEGERLFGVMEVIRQKDFCVATAWTSFQVSIAKTCGHSGVIFQIQSDYRTISAPDGTFIDVETAKYEDIDVHLPKYTLRMDIAKRRAHCSFDNDRGLLRRYR
ncbi:hypothetical protein J4218_06600 [Candidatus Pacearchaeota archaeon]|nr:hypothetical protein [Candidatus Pacearchaeota archaeon]